MNSQLIAFYGETVTYSRPLSTSFAAVAPFTLTGIPDTGGGFADPTGPLEGNLEVNTADVPLGPQKGDHVSFTDPGTSLRAGTYRVQELFTLQDLRSTGLKLRWVGP